MTPLPLFLSHNLLKLLLCQSLPRQIKRDPILTPILTLILIPLIPKSQVMLMPLATPLAMGILQVSQTPTRGKRGVFLQMGVGVEAEVVHSQRAMMMVMMMQ
jgi:hypothetical protein